MYNNQDEKLWCMIAHLSAFAGFIFSFLGFAGGFIGPLVVWLLKKDQSYVIADSAKEALNFNISFTIYSIIAYITVFLLIGIVLVPIVYIAWVVLIIIGSVKAYQGQPFRYPLTFRFIK